MKDKIDLAMKRKGLNQTDLAKILKVTPQAVQQWLSGVTSPKGKRLSNLAKALSVSQLWLLGETDNEDADAIDEFTDLTDVQREFLLIMNNLTQAQQEELLRKAKEDSTKNKEIMNELLEKQKNVA